jgi:hypothetical protein
VRGRGERLGRHVSMSTAARITLFVALWLLFECLISWAAFCHHSERYGGYYQTAENENYACVFKGPAMLILSGIGSMWNSVFDKPDAYVALFTAVLAVSTIALWWVTRKAATAAEQSAHTARDALISTQRAFVRVSGWPWLWRPDTDRPGKYFYDINPIVENTGNTPTVDLMIAVNWQLRDTSLPDDFDFANNVPPGPSLIAAHQSIGAGHVHILDDDLLLVQKRQKHFYIWVEITYRDVFGGTPVHTTEFCTEISRVIGNPLDPRDPNNPKGTGVEIDFRIYPKHQKAD